MYLLNKGLIFFYFGVCAGYGQMDPRLGVSLFANLHGCSFCIFLFASLTLILVFIVLRWWLAARRLPYVAGVMFVFSAVNLTLAYQMWGERGERNRVSKEKRC